MDEEVVGGRALAAIGGGEEEEQERGGGEVYCAVGNEAGKEWRANLRWVMANFPRSRRLVLAHVHRPPHRINMMGAWVPVGQLVEQEVAAHRKLEEDKASRALDDLLRICTSQQVRARKVIVSGDDAASGLVRLVHDHSVADLVMGAASDRAYTRRMRAPRSKKALTVERKANPSCRIWFLCKGNLICTREASERQQSRAGSSSTASTIPIASDCSRSRSSFGGMQHEWTDPAALRRTPSRDDDTDDATDHSVEDLSNEATAPDVAGSSSAAPVPVSEEAHQGGSPREVEDNPPTPSRDGSDDAGGEMDGDAWCDRLRDVLMEAESLRHEAHEETRRRQKAERDLADASKMANEAESSCQDEARHRKEMEERLARERAAMEHDRRELDAILEQTREVNDRSDKLELQIADSERMVSDLDVRMAESYSVLDTLRRQRRREDPAAAAESTSAIDGDQGGVSFLRLDLSELEEATNNFDESVRIGGQGGVYRGNLRDMSVAVKMICPDVAVDEVQFTRGVEVISRVEHPNLVTLVGACPEARALVYEFLPGGSLEDRLGGEGAVRLPLPWHARCGVAYQTCSALAFLYSTRPRATVHGDIRPANILLEDEQCFTSKLAGLGTHGLVARERPRIGEALAYTDPWYLATGELTPQCDVHALGVVLLRLVTGKRAFAAKKAAQDAAAGSKSWHDTSAGGWPTERAREVALLGLNLCDVRRRRPAGGLLEEARSVLEAAVSAAAGRTWSSLSSDSGGDVPSYFMCPILKEVMKDPQIAGDGFTYEADAMREWLGSGHGTSPMTNLKLPTDELIPNHALRAAIQEWRHTRPASS